MDSFDLPATTVCGPPPVHSAASSAALGVLLRQQLAGVLDALSRGHAPLRLPAAAGVARGAGHFHLAPELFLQLSGWTRFDLPHGHCVLHAGEALLMPPRLLHDEVVGAGAGPGRGATVASAPFSNIVIYAGGPQLTCHLAHESAPGRPGILYLETRHDSQAARVHDWLHDAARLAGPGGLSSAPGSATADASPSLAATQARALVVAVVAGVLRLLDAASPPSERGGTEPALLARLRVLVQNQLGDHQLSVGRLAEQSGCTADHLSHLFSLSTGERLMVYINRLRMERAQHLLTHTDLAGKEIAWACGFAAQSYFIRMFRSHHGMTPAAWRARAPSSFPL